ncbi:hypothetical protein AAHA92_21996 [Salvia divinorum]|uniref:VOC domain-containing protein n=1 Tax=Salvia divinorum TaxID=28513 RepID=A0ABD1GMQ9_SALDI
MRYADEKHEEEKGAPLMALNHVLGFVLIKRPESFHFDGVWLFNYGIGIHLVQSKDEDKLPTDKDRLDPMDNHISFQCEDVEAMVKQLKEMNIKYMKRTVGDQEGAVIDQLFFKDPDGFMIEICNCENLKLMPQRSIGRVKLPFDKHNPPIDLPNHQQDMFVGDLLLPTSLFHEFNR